MGSDSSVINYNSSSINAVANGNNTAVNRINCTAGNRTAASGKVAYSITVSIGRYFRRRCTVKNTAGNRKGTTFIINISVVRIDCTAVNYYRTARIVPNCRIWDCGIVVNAAIDSKRAIVINKTP